MPSRGPLAHSREYRDTTVVGGDPVDHLLDEHRLADTRSTEEADLSTLHVGLEEVDDLDPRLEHRRTRLECVECRRVSVDVPAVVVWADVVGVERHAHDVEDVTEHGVADRDGDPPSGVADGRASHEPVGRLQADAADPALADLLRDLGDDRDLLAVEHEVHLDGEVDLGKRVRRELRVDDGTGDGHDAALVQRLPVRCDAAGAVVVVIRSFLLGTLAERFCAPHDLHDLGRDRVLAGPVHHPRECLRELVGVLGRRGHRSLARGVLARCGLEHRLEDRRLDVACDQLVEDVDARQARIRCTRAARRWSRRRCALRLLVVVVVLFGRPREPTGIGRSWRVSTTWVPADRNRVEIDENLVDRFVREWGPHREGDALASSNVGLSDMPVNECSTCRPRYLR